MPVVPDRMPHIDDMPCQIGRASSATQVALPLAHACNHIQGYLLRGMWHVQSCNADGEAPGNGQMYIYRHPNCTHIFGCLGVSEITQATATVSVKAGTGLARSYSCRATHLDSVLFDVCAPFSTADSGYTTVTVSSTDCSVRWSMFGDLYRDSLSAATEDCVDLYSTTYRRCGLSEGEVISDSATAGPARLIAEPANAWTNARRQAVSWWTCTALSCSSAAWVNPFGTDANWRHQARKQRSTDATMNYRVYARTWCDAGTTYDWQCTSSYYSNVVQETGKTQTTATWNSAGGLATSNVSGENFIFEMRRTAGSGDMYISGLSILEDDQ